MRKLLLSAVALLALSAQNAFAINLTFQFDVNSSGPSIYACNAGIRHVAATNVCYDRNTNQSCTPGCAAGIVSQCLGGSAPSSCVCTGENYDSGTQGTWRLDFLQANSAAWTDNQVQAGASTAHLLAATGSSSFNQITTGAFPALNAYGRQLKDLTINLGSEIYNAEYFVDICYRGPQIDYRHNGQVVPGLNFGLKANATIFDIKLADGVSYRSLSTLQVKAEAKCIMNDDFDYCLADIIPGETAGCESSSSLTTHTYGKISNNGVFVDMSGSAINVAKLITDASMNSNNNVTPRFCQIRYSFQETSKKIRKWKLQQARICTYTEISEPTIE